MEALGQKRCLGNFTRLTSPLSRRSRLTARAFKDDSMTAANGKPGELRGGMITFKVPANPPQPLAQLPAVSSAGAASSSSTSPPPSAVKATVIATPPPAAAAIPLPDLTGPQSELLPPPLAYHKMAATGAVKAQMGLSKLIVLSLLAGVYVSLGGLLALSLGTSCPGLAQSNPGLKELVQNFIGIPFGLITVVLCGAELFNGNVAFLAAAFWEKKATIGQVLRNWIVSYIGNFVGALFVIKLVTVAGLVIAAPSAVTTAARKTSLPFIQALTRGILGNWLVCLAVWQSSAASSLPGKVLGVTLPLFVGMGFENSIANMFLIPTGIAAGANFGLQHFFSSNLLPVTLGNIIGGALFVATPYALAYGRQTA